MRVCRPRGAIVKKRRESGAGRSAGISCQTLTAECTPKPARIAVSHEWGIQNGVKIRAQITRANLHIFLCRFFNTFLRSISDANFRANLTCHRHPKPRAEMRIESGIRMRAIARIRHVQFDALRCAFRCTFRSRSGALFEVRFCSRARRNSWRFAQRFRRGSARHSWPGFVRTWTQEKSRFETTLFHMSSEARFSPSKSVVRGARFRAP